MPRKRPNELCECDWSNQHTSTVYKWRLRHTRHKENNIYLNEINTMPGFTKISMYPKLFESDKISYSELLDILINYAISKFDFT